MSQDFSVGEAIAVYRPHQTNICPDCGRSHWLVGRLLAECAICATALPIHDVGASTPALFWANGSPRLSLAA